MHKEKLEVRYLGRLLHVIQADELGEPAGAMRLMVRMPSPEQSWTPAVWHWPLSIANVPVLITVEPLEVDCQSVGDQVGVKLTILLALEEDANDAEQIHPNLQWYDRASLLGESLHPLWGNVDDPDEPSGRVKNREFRGSSFTVAVERAIMCIRRDLDKLQQLVQSREDQVTQALLELDTTDFTAFIAELMRQQLDG